MILAGDTSTAAFLSGVDQRRRVERERREVAACTSDQGGVASVERREPELLGEEVAAFKNERCGSLRKTALC
jgi:hypothetical protein